MRRSNSFKRARSNSVSSSQATQLDSPALSRRQSRVAGKANLKRVVMQVLDRQREEKEAVGGTTLLPGCLQSTSASVAGNVFAVSPSSAGVINVASGTGNGQRIGNKITTKRLIHVLTLTPAAQAIGSVNPTPLPYYIRVYWVKRKGNTINAPGTAQLTTTATANFFEIGAGLGTAGFTGDLIDMGKFVNKDDYVYLTHRDYKLGPAINTQQASTTFSNYANNDFKFTIVDRVDLTKYCPKTILYDDDDVSTQPTIYCICQIVPADGSAANPLWVPVQWRNEVMYKYTDM